MKSIYIFVLIAFCFSSINALMFHLQPGSRRCLKEEVQKNVLVTGEYSLSEAVNQRVDLIVQDTKGHTLVSRENIGQSKFAFNTDDYDIFEICFISKVPPMHGGIPREVTLEVKHGPDATNYASVAEVGKLKPLEVELQKLEHLSNGIVNDFAHMKRREEEMRDTNESTNSRVLYFSIFSMVCLLLLATWQVLYLRQFFKSKKLIE
ncbi:TMED10 [Cordylochernes scorpioides]|uniref:TMED10 n=1 Tax=Cordylochernes scorpioides TaxID=51811 RepID=A0ABY6LH02_9ARAC|nr:TMED10 [Cordylochernes scorpioides]